MGTFKRNERDLGADRRRKALGPIRRGPLHFETLEGRTLLATSTGAITAASANLTDVRNGPMANEGQILINVYQAYLQHSNPGVLAKQFPLLQFQGDGVAVTVKGTGDFNTFVSSLTNLGFKVGTPSPKYNLVEGTAPIASLPAIAQLPQVRNAAPIEKPIVHFVGAADNEGETALQAATARQQAGVDGTGVTIGVLSDSVSQFQGGLADSVKTGDLPNTVKVLQDGPAGATDEGRAMLENIHDIAPGASLQFATADGGQVGFANNILALASSGSKVIVDDVGYPYEPYFQDGAISQSVNTVVGQGSTYLSAVGNVANQGYLSSFRAVKTTIPALGAGTFMNFAPTGAAVTGLPITIGQGASAANPVPLVFQFDQPYSTYETGAAPGPTSEVDFYVLDSSGAIVAAGTNNNVTTGTPIQEADITAPGSYTVVMQLVSGTAPQHVEFVNDNEQVDVTVSQQFGTGPAAGNTYYPGTFGHSAAANTIGIGAVPWFATAPYINQNPLKNEPFSSFGPVLSDLSPDGVAQTAQLIQNPVVSGPDGGNTSFFGPGQIIDTSNPPFPGEPATPTNLSQNLPSFFGTSSAAPNVAAVVTLMLQKNPGLTPAQVKTSLIASAQPLNGSAAGTWNAQGGYGFVNAVKAVTSIAPLNVVTTTPSVASTVGATPTQIDVTFNKPVVFSTVTAADLTFTSLPPGVASVVVGTPIALDNPTDPTMVRFPITVVLKAGQTSNGTFDYTVGGSIQAQDGNALTPFTTGSFTINDVNPPHVIGVKLNGRVVSIQFDKALAPTISTQTVFVALTDAQGNIITNLDNYPGFKQSYDSTTNTVNLDYSALPQADLPTGYYKIVVLGGDQLPNGTFQPGITDLSGNKLDGTFYGVFPSGFNPAISGTTIQTDRNFDDFLGLETVSAPVITSLQLTPATDTGIQGDENTNINHPIFVGQVTNSFPGTISGVTIQAQFSGLHGGSVNLTTVNGRGSVGAVDVTTTTDANGTFTIPNPGQPIFLPEGFQSVRLVAIGQSDTPVLPGYSSQFDHAFRIDQTPPSIVSATLAPVSPTAAAALPLGAVYSSVSSLSTISLDVVDPANPSSGPFSTPPSITFPALNPTVASNISNYTLKQILPGGLSKDVSNYITSATFTATAADFVSAPNRTTSADPYDGRIDLTIAPGLPAGQYQLIAHTTEGTFAGLTDAAGNPLNETNVPGEGTSDFYVSFNLQSQPVYVTSVSTNVANAQGNTLLPYSYYEINPRPGDIVSNPPTAFYVDVSTPLDPTTINNDSLQLIAAGTDVNGVSTGDFGQFGEGGLGSTGTGFSRFDPAGSTVSLVDGPNGTNTRIVLQLPAGTVLPANHYRFYIPNNSASLAVRDIFHNQLDGEFLGNPAATGAVIDGNPGYEDQLPDGEFRAGMSGDGVGGGSFTAGFVVVPSGNLIYARPDYVEDPLLTSTEPDGSISKPYSVLAPQAAVGSLPAAAQATYDNGDPNGGLNDTSNFTAFNPNQDKADIHQFARSAFYAASQLAMRGPVVIVALPGTQQRDPNSGVVSQKTFVLQAPAGANPAINDGSASVPFDSLLVFNAGSTLKLQNASLFVQNQGSALQTLGGTNLSDHVTFTSISDNSVGANPNGPAGNSTPQAGDWGGIVFRNFNDAIAGRTDTFPIDGTLVGSDGSPAISGADDSLSAVTFTDIRYGGGAVPATTGTRYDSVTLYNSRPEIAQDSITLSATNGGTGAQAAISADLDSFREDDTRRGPLIRRVSVANNSLNGILIRADLSGAAEVTDAMIYPDNPSYIGGQQNYAFDAPLPYILTSRLVVGSEVLSDTAQLTALVNDRVYMQPGTIFKFQRGAGIEVLRGASINVGERQYIAGYDSQVSIDPKTGLTTSTYGPLLPNGSPNPAFQINPAGAQPVIFTSLYDNTATTAVVPEVDSANTDPTSTFGNPGPIDPYQPTPGNVPALARWGSITVDSGAIGAIDQSDIRYGGGSLNVPGGTITRNALTIGGSAAFATTSISAGGVITTSVTSGTGGHVSITNNNFDSNADAPIYIDPNALLATDPLRPLASGHPFFHGNLLTNNDDNALAVGFGESGATGDLSNTSIWDQTDITYLLRGTIYADPPVTNTTNTGLGSTAPPLGAITPPSLVLTIQSALPGSLLADGTTVPTPGASVIVKLLGTGTGNDTNGQNTTGLGAPDTNGGAGFLFGVDNNSILADLLGNNSQLRILGVGGNETTGQQRVPVVITSANDSTVGTTVRGVKMYQVIPGDTNKAAAGDGGVIGFGGNSLTTYNALDIREGNKIDNADISYVTRIEMQGGGNIDTLPGLAGSNGLAGNLLQEKAGVLPPLANGAPNPNDGYIQRNAPKELTVSNSNFNAFSQVGILEQPGNNLIVDGFRDNPQRGEPNQLFVYNSTFSNMPVGVRIVGDPATNDIQIEEPNELLLLNNTFYNDAIGADAVTTAFNGLNFNAHVHFIAMDNIFSNSSTAGIQSINQTQGSVLEYNLFYQNGADVTGPLSGVNYQPVNGNPMFVNAAALNFDLMEGSAAIDAARSELDLNSTSTGAFVGTLIPLDSQVLSMIGGIRNTNNRQPDSFNNGQALVSNELTLPGYGSSQPSLRGYVDEFQAVLPGTPGSVAGPASNASTFAYLPISGERDINGLFRQKDPSSSNVGFGSRPFFDIGAHEYRVFVPPHVTGITATVLDTTTATGLSTINLYAVGTYAGTNKPIQTIQVTFDDPIDPNTINSQSVQLEATNGTGSFNSPIFYNLSGKLSLDPTDRILTINVGAAGLVLNNDEFRLILNGNGQNVIKDTKGIALDGQNTLNDQPNNPQLPLPSGSGAPGTNFYDTFIINSSPPAVLPFTFQLDPSTDSNIIGDSVTNYALPSFSGTVSVPLSSIEPLAGLTVILDISTKGNGVFDRLNAGTALTMANGSFLVTVGQDGAGTGLVTNTSPLPDSIYNVGPDGILRTKDDSGYTWARIRVIDQSGNASDLPTDTNAQFAAKNALSAAVIDTAPPTITSFSPAPNSLIQPTNGSITFTFTTNKNIDPKTLNANSILVTNAGPDGILGTADDVAVPINAASITTTYLGNAAPNGSRLGPERISFTVSGGLSSNYYAVTLKGSGANAITDIAGNPLAGNGTTVATDFNPTYVVIIPATNVIYVNASATASVLLPPDGTIEDPYTTIGAAMAAAVPGNTIAVLPGVYTENVVLKPFVKLVSASPNSTDTTLIPGNALQTVIRAPEPSATSTTTSTGPNATILAQNLPYIPGADNVVSGFTITSPLLGTLDSPSNPAQGPVDPNTAAIEISNANVLLLNNYITDANVGVYVVATNGTGVLMPRIFNNVIAGNNVGLQIDDEGSNTIPNPSLIDNNDFVYNTVGLFANDSSASPLLATAANDIFWQNHDQTSARNGYGILANAPNTILVRNSLFQGNGASDTSPAFAGINVGFGFNAAALKATPDRLGNYTGNPSFVFPIDPRPGSDGPAAFALDADFDLQSNSAAIDTANEFYALPTDFLGRTRVRIPGRGFTGTGPADVGAFEYKGTGGTTVGGAFRVASTSLSATGAATTNGSTIYTAQTAPKAITVTFSAPVNRATVTPSSLLVYGDGVSAVSGVRVSSVTFTSPTTAVFKLSGSYSSTGTVVIKVNPGTVKSTTNSVIQGFADSFKISSTLPVKVTKPTAPVTPVAVAGPKAVTTKAVVATTPVVNLHSAPITPAPAAAPSGPLAVRKTATKKK